MIRGLYTSASGMAIEQVRQDVTSNNLANANTSGFKRDDAVIRSFPAMLLQRYNDFSQPQAQDLGIANPVIGRLGTGAQVETVATLHSLGSLKSTENPLDLALAGEGFFVVQTPQGERYTRNGSFRLNQDQTLVTSEGYPVLGQAGLITLQAGEVKVDEKGAISQGDQWVDNLQIVRFTVPKTLVKEGDSLFWAGQPQAGQAQAQPETVDSPQVRQGFLEGSNVNVVAEMVNMIQVMRAYEANQKAIQTQDATLDKTVNEVGRV